MKKIKTGIIGTGFIGHAHLEAIRRLGFVEVIGVAESSLEMAEKKAKLLGVPRAYSDFHEMLLDPDIEVVHNCTPNYLHFEINKQSILAGKHVLSEKPLAVSSTESAELIALAKMHNVVHGVNFNYRQFPSIRQIKSMIRSGELGKINLIHGSYLQDWLLYETDYNWRLAPEYGGDSRAIADIGSHWCDIVQYVTGKKISDVFADLATIHPFRKRSKEKMTTFGNVSSETNQYEDVPINTEDYASVILRFDDGSKGFFTVSQVSAGRKNRLSFELNGSLSSVSWNQEEPEKIWIGHRNRPNEILLADPSLYNAEAQSSIHYPGGHNEGWPDALKNMMLNFYTFIKEEKNLEKDKPNFATFEDGHRSMCLIESILESYKKQKWVKVKIEKD